MPHTPVRAAGVMLLVLTLLGPAPALAQGVPSPSNSTIPACFQLVGSDGVLGSLAFGRFEVIHRDLANNPVPDALIVVDLSQAPDLFLASEQMDATVTVDCLNKRVSRRTDAEGRAVFCVIGASSVAAGSRSLLNAGRIYADGMLLGSPTVGAYDLDGTNGLGAEDLSIWLGDFISGLPCGRSDFDCNGSIGAGDLSRWLTAFASGTQVVSMTSACP